MNSKEERSVLRKERWDESIRCWENPESEVEEAYNKIWENIDIHNITDKDFELMTERKKVYLNVRNKIRGERYKKHRKALNIKNLVIPTGIERTEGFVKHHISRCFTLSIPSFIHYSLPHWQLDEESMIQINEKALKWLLGEWETC